jgi:hypothetical protein
MHCNVWHFAIVTVLYTVMYVCTHCTVAVPCGVYIIKKTCRPTWAMAGWVYYSQIDFTDDFRARIEKTNTR